MSRGKFEPKLFTVFKEGYSLKQLGGDVIAGVIVGVVALPLAIAFAIASGVTPDRGLVTAIIAGFIISVLGGSRVQVGGPTGAFVVIVYGIVQQHGVDGLIVATMIAGILLVLMGVFRLGGIVKFVPYPVTVGFTSGIAVVIFSSQIKDFLGLKIAGELPGDFVGKWAVYFHNMHTVDWTTVGVSVLALLIVILWPRINRRIPGPIVALVVVTLIVYFFNLPTDTIGSRFGDLPHGLPKPHIPRINFETIRQLIGPAVTIALLGAIESLLSASVADGMIEGRHRSNTELIAQGVANMVVPFFGGIPATGAIARTVTNIKNGARTPVAGIVHSIVLFLIVLFFGKLAKMIPLSVLAAILVMVSYHMSEWHAFRALLKAPKSDVTVLITTFFLTVLVDLTVAVQIGLVMSVFLFMKRMRDVSNIKQVKELNLTGEDDDMDEAAVRHDPNSTTSHRIPKGVAVYEAEGALFFGVAEMFRDTLDIGKNPPKVLILRMRRVLAFDATGLRALSDLHKKCQDKKVTLILAGVHTQPYVAMDNSDFLEVIGSENVLRTFDEALTRAQVLLQNGA